MRAFLAAVMLVVAVAGAASAKKFRGAPVDLDFQAVDVRDVFKLIADVGKVSIVLVDVPEIRLDVKVKRQPWDQLFEDLIARSKLAYHPTGSVLLVGAPAWIAERKKLKPRRYTGTPVDLDVNGADVGGVAQLLRVVAGAKVEAQPGAKRKVALRVRNVPVDHAFALAALQAGATEQASTTAAPPAAPAGCVAPAAPLAKLTLVAVARAKLQRAALFVDDTGGLHVVRDGACLGKEAAKARVRDLWVEAGDGAAALTFQVYPRRP